MFEFNVSKVKIKAVHLESVTTGSVNVYECLFNFNEDWDGLARTAVFRVCDQIYSVILDETNKCVIPWELFVDENVDKALFIGAYGVLDSDIVLPTVWAYAGTILQGVKDGSGSLPPSPDLMAQILSELEQKVNIEDEISNFEIQRIWNEVN